MSTVMMLILLMFLLQVVYANNLPPNPALHFPLYRRGGRFTHNESVNLKKLSEVLHTVEARYSRTHRNIESNRLVRRWTSSTSDSVMLDEAGLDGRWYTILNIGDLPQSLEVDIDFLNPDFYTILTTSEDGSKFNTFASQAYVAGDTFAHPLCRLPSDQLHLQNRVSPISLTWPICQPSKSSRHTLSRSGTILGLAPSLSPPANSLSRLIAPSFIRQLLEKGVITSSIWSMTFLDSDTGFLSVGGSIAAEVEEAKTKTELELKYLDHEDVKQQIEDEIKARMAFAIPAGSTVEDHFRWIDVSGASGWWTGLIGGVWVNGHKILKNQPFLLDPACPFILAPPTAFSHLYHSISGSKPMSSHKSFHSADDDYANHVQSNHTFKENLYLFPCLNPPAISLELAGWPFPLASQTHSTQSDAFHGPAGGVFSLGKAEEVLSTTNNSTDSGDKGHNDNSGFCVGIIVKSDMGERTKEEWITSGMRDTWVLGEPFFRGLGIAFDDGGVSGKARMGFRSY